MMYFRVTFTTLLLLLLLFLMAPLIVPGGLGSLTLALNCTGTTTIKGPHEAATINDLKYYKDEDSYKFVYTWVHVEPGFKGVSVEAVVVGGTTHAAFFPSDDTCFDDDTVWWWMVVAWVRIIPHNNDNNNNDDNNDNDNDNLQDLTFEARFGRCRLWCLKTMENLQAAWRLQVVAHGPSSWTKDRQGCTYRVYYVPTPRTTNCDEPIPAEGPHTTNTSPAEGPHTTNTSPAEGPHTNSSSSTPSGGKTASFIPAEHERAVIITMMVILSVLTVAVVVLSGLVVRTGNQMVDTKNSS